TICALVRRLDFGIDDLQASELSESPEEQSRVHAVLKAVLPSFNPSNIGKPQRLKAIRQGVSFDLARDESAGTAMAVTLVGPIVDALARGGVLVIDEFNARLHT